ncbi:MAG: hypothetical protein KAH67_00035 [Flavobacteriaceae bacterium]|nr:hypothetical protein [Flavobacteriaceae bacterium]
MNKKNKLYLGILFDLIGMLSFVFPPIDFVWAPLSAYIMIKMYKGNVGKIGGLVSFVEEAIPGLDFFPSFTLTWLYVYKYKKKN